jgi:tRNA A37 threonylcarbamoyltransferase TsaD
LYSVDHSSGHVLTVANTQELFPFPLLTLSLPIFKWSKSLL